MVTYSIWFLPAAPPAITARVGDAQVPISLVREEISPKSTAFPNVEISAYSIELRLALTGEGAYPPTHIPRVEEEVPLL